MSEGVAEVAIDEFELNDASYFTTLAVVLVPQPIYRVRASTGPIQHKILPRTAVIDSGAGLNIISRKVFVQLGWSTMVLNIDMPRLRGANVG